MELFNYSFGLDTESWIQLRVPIFLGVLAFFVIAEQLFKERPQAFAWPRLARHLSFVGLGSLLIRLVLPFTLVGIAAWTQREDIGLFNWLNWPNTLSVVLSIVLLDVMIYLQHVITHRVPLLWRLHRVHHSDIRLDASSALRFHPLELLLSYAFKAGIIVTFGIAPLAAVVFEILLSSLAIFNHSNLYLPPRFEYALRYLVVTPQMHVIHHSKESKEHHQNFGFCLSLWDHIFGTYLGAPEKSLNIGLKQTKHQSLWDLTFKL